MPYADKKKQRECQRDYMRKKKKSNPHWHAELARRKKEKRQCVQDIVAQVKITFGCLLCSEKNPDNLHFHHVLPHLKIATISDMVSSRTKLFRILKEIDKCVCVCTACHKQFQITIKYITAIIKAEKWYSDWGINEALEWVSLHPQSRLNKEHFIEILKAVAKNCQFQDAKLFFNVKDT
jgi:transcription elongation factor Elf1